MKLSPTAFEALCQKCHPDHQLALLSKIRDLTPKKDQVMWFVDVTVTVAEALITGEAHVPILLYRVDNEVWEYSEGKRVGLNRP